MCNIDRELEGNILLALSPGGGFRLVAADQSDCLGGSGRFADGSWITVMANARPAATLPFCQRAIFDSGGSSAIRRAVHKVQQAASALDAAVASVPYEWWRESGIDPPRVEKELADRSRRIGDILNINQWENLRDDIQGGHLL